MTDINKTPDNVEVSGGDINKTEPENRLYTEAEREAVARGASLGLRQYQARLESQGKQDEAKELLKWIEEIERA